MKDLDISERIELWKIAHSFPCSAQDSRKVTALRNQAIQVLYGDSAMFALLKKNKTRREVNLCNEMIKGTNDFITLQSRAKEHILLAGSQLISNFNEAENNAREAIRFASGNPNNYDISEKEMAAYFETNEAKNITTKRKAGENVNHPEDILNKQKFVKNAKNTANCIADSLMVDSPEFRTNRIRYIKKSLEGQEYNAKFIDMGGQIQFRTIRPEGDYGKPEITFKEGLAPQFVSVFGFQSGLINKPYINDELKTEGERIGWSGGVVSTSANIKFCAAFDFAASYGIQDGLIYAYACDEAASVARHISFGVGYDGKVDKNSGIERSNAEAAMEYVLPYLSPERIVGAREIKKDGTLGAFFPNHNVNRTAYGDTEFLKLMLCNSVDELRVLEYLEGRSVEMKHDDNPLEYSNRMTHLFTQFPTDRQAIILKLTHAANTALDHQFAKNIDPALEENDPERFAILRQIDFSGNSSKSAGDLHKNIVQSLEYNTKSKLDSYLTKEKDIKVESHFVFEFEKDKRAPRTITETTQMYKS